jgi:hypothetical protein
MNGQFYVYLWLDPRTTPMTPRYVGKGIDGRAWTWNRKKDKNALLYEMLVELWKVRRRPYVMILELFDTEAESFVAEVAAIRKYGRADLGSGTLFNCSDGGRGNSNFRGSRNLQSPERRAASSERMKLLNSRPEHQNKAHYKKRTDPETRAALAERMRVLNDRPEFKSDERRAAASKHLTALNRTRTYSPEERTARSVRATAMNKARATAKHE